jgi:death-on-curing protein
MNEPVWVLSDVVIAVQQMLLAGHGGLSGIRDKALLESALARPQQAFAYDDALSLVDLAAAYSYGLAKNHPFVDGNKRIALTVAVVFLELNGCSLSAPEPETVLVFEQLAAGELMEKELASWFEKYVS